MELLMELLGEVFFEVYGEIILAIVPDKNLKKWQKNLLRFLCLIVFFSGIIMFGIGLSAYFGDGNRTFAPVLIGVGGSLFGLQIVLSVTAFGCRIKRKQREAQEQAAQEQAEAEQAAQAEELRDSSDGGDANTQN